MSVATAFRGGESGPPPTLRSRLAAQGRALGTKLVSSVLCAGELPEGIMDGSGNLDAHQVTVLEVTWAQVMTEQARRSSEDASSATARSQLCAAMFLRLLEADDDAGLADDYDPGMGMRRGRRHGGLPGAGGLGNTKHRLASEAVVEAMGTLIDSLGSDRSAQGVKQEIARMRSRLEESDATPRERWPVIRDALLGGLGDSLQSKWTSGVQDTWTVLLDLVLGAGAAGG